MMSRNPQTEWHVTSMHWLANAGSLPPAWFATAQQALAEQGKSWNRESTLVPKEPI